MSSRRSQEEFLSDLFELFRVEGVSELTVGEIARRLSCSRSRLYSVAETKEELFLVVAKQHLNSLLLESDALRSKDGDVVEIITQYLDIGVRASALLGVPFLKDLDASRQGRRLFDSYQEKRGQGLAHLVQRGVEKGVFHPRHAILVAEILMGGALRIRRTRFLARTGLTLEEAFSEFYELLLHGLMKQGHGRQVGLSQNWKLPALPDAAVQIPESSSDDTDADGITELLIKASVRH
ncbi:MAG: TetR/AcrR family transcriptional regulator [Comamonas sp.]|uniref:TetR/AcrR family transcriptional regulator n=1 Tax=Comamonas sp. TaxID=34028 RepID=UPI002FC7035B